MPEEMQDICEICREHIGVGIPQVRVVGDAMVSSSPTKYSSLIKNKVIVFGCFHASCLREADGDDTMDDVPYIWEARALMEVAPAVGADTEPSKPSRRHLKIIQGGIR